MSAHSPWDELAVGLALGALEPEDEQTFLGHLSTCSECAQTVADIEAVSGQLAYAVPADDPPPALLKSIMKVVVESDRAASPLSSALPNLARLRAPLRRRTASAPAFRNPSWLLRAAAFVLVIALAGWNYQLRLDNRVKDRSLSNAAKAAALLAEPGTSLVKLEGKGAENATVLINRDKGYLVVDNFKRNDAEDTIYVLWTQNRAGQMVGVDSFKIAHDGPSYVPVRKPLTDTSGTFAVSKESGRVIPKTPSPTIVIGTAAVTANVATT
ncbi:MAG: anti-sigma factor [Actinomycetota bacterium]